MTTTNLVFQQNPTVAQQDTSNSKIMTFAEITSYYDKNNCWGMLSSLDAKNCNPDLIRSADAIKQYVVELCDLIGMKRFQDTVVVNFGEDEKVAGYSMVQLIETSLISGHFANLTNAAYIDIFSCKMYDPYVAAEFTRNYFEATDAAVNICFRK